MNTKELIEIVNLYKKSNEIGKTILNRCEINTKDNLKIAIAIKHAVWLGVCLGKGWDKESE